MVIAVVVVVVVVLARVSAVKRRAVSRHVEVTVLRTARISGFGHVHSIGR